MGTCGRFPSFILLCKTPWQCSSISTLHKARTHVYKRSETVAISSGWKCLQKADIWCEWHVWALKETLVGSRLTESMFSDHRFSRFAAGSACCPVWKLVGAGVCSWLLVKWAVRKSDMTREWSQQFPWVLCVFNFRLLRSRVRAGYYSPASPNSFCANTTWRTGLWYGMLLNKPGLGKGGILGVKLCIVPSAPHNWATRHPEAESKVAENQQISTIVKSKIQKTDWLQPIDWAHHRIWLTPTVRTVWKVASDIIASDPAATLLLVGLLDMCLWSLCFRSESAVRLLSVTQIEEQYKTHMPKTHWGYYVTKSLTHSWVIQGIDRWWSLTSWQERFIWQRIMHMTRCHSDTCCNAAINNLK